MDNRSIIHIDADCFFAALEMRDKPALRHVPLAVGGDPSRRGVISTCNYLARQFGVHSAMGSAQALKLCPGLQIVSHRMPVYREASQAMRQIFSDYSDLVEPVSLDEAYLDVSAAVSSGREASAIATEIRKRVAVTLEITVSAGVAPNKFLAKIASDWRKPDGLTVIDDSQVDSFTAKLPVHKINGVGPVTASRMRQLGIKTCGDLRHLSIAELEGLFGSFGQRLYLLCRGVDHRQVQPERRRKSLSVEHTFAEDLPGKTECEQKLLSLCDSLQQRLMLLDESYRVTKAFVKVKFCDFSSTTVEQVITTWHPAIYSSLCYQALDRHRLPVRLLGVGVRFAEQVENRSAVEAEQLRLLG